MKEFMKKVEFERSVLRWVNHRFGKPQLRVVSSRKLSDWAKEHQTDPNTLASLERISELLAVLSNRSGERSSLGFQSRIVDIQKEIKALTSHGMS